MRPSQTVSERIQNRQLFPVMQDPSGYRIPVGVPSVYQGQPSILINYYFFLWTCFISTFSKAYNDDCHTNRFGNIDSAYRHLLHRVKEKVSLSILCYGRVKVTNWLIYLQYYYKLIKKLAGIWVPSNKTYSKSVILGIFGFRDKYQTTNFLCMFRGPNIPPIL